MAGKSATTKIFKSGNSTAVRLPASFGAVPGTVVEVREEQGRWIVEAVPEKPRKIDVASFYGSMPGLTPLTPEEREFEDRPSERLERERNGG